MSMLGIEIECCLCMYCPLTRMGLCSLTSWDSTDCQWIQMRNKELKYIHDKSYMRQNPQQVSRKRALVLDWLFEVCAFYCLQRQTAYLAQDYLDRYLMTQDRVDSSSMQLLGITALFIAAKKEEVYPPKINAFAYVTDGACEVWEIERSEIQILKALNWNLSPETPISWLNLYVQIEADQSRENFLDSIFSQELYLDITQLLDLCILDINSLDFNYSTLASAAICHFTSYNIVHTITGMSWDTIASCYLWMSAFVDVLRYSPKPQMKASTKVKPSSSHNIQTHNITRDMLRRAQENKSYLSNLQMSPLGLGGFLTPPSSAEKFSPYSFEFDLMATLSDD
ncbi:unnamed protein product [Ophioblennius macclurei]